MSETVKNIKPIVVDHGHILFTVTITPEAPSLEALPEVEIQ